MLPKMKIVVVLLAVAFMLAMMFATTPSGVGPLGVLVFFTMFYIVSFGATSTLCKLFFVVRGKIDKVKRGGEEKKSFYYGAVLAFAPVLLLGMQAFGGIGWLEVVAVTLAVAITCFLVAKKIL